MRYLKYFEQQINIISGEYVWASALKAGSEHNDGLEYYENEIKSKNYYLLSIPIYKILDEDTNVKHGVEVEMIPYAKNGGEFSYKREIKQPIIIGKVNRGGGGGPTFINGVIDGSNRVCQAFVNGQKEIMAYVPVDSIFVKNS